MKRELDEQLSALLDGEVRPEEMDLLLARIERDDHARRRLERYGLIGAALRGESAAPLDDFVGQVRSRLVEAEGQRLPVPEQRGPRAGMGLAAALAAGLVIAAALGLAPRPDPYAPPSPQVAAGVSSASTVARVMDPRNAYRPAPMPPGRLTTYLVAHRSYAGEFVSPAWESRVLDDQATEVAWSAAQAP
jgi:sigma-E factor negative regulatory protein RseA